MKNTHCEYQLKQRGRGEIARESVEPSPLLKLSAGEKRMQAGKTRENQELSVFSDESTSLCTSPKWATIWHIITENATHLFYY